jgi:N4-gp56 family major capsid protein
MAITNSTAVAADLQTYLAAQLLIVAERDVVFKRYGMNQPIPANSSKTISFTQYSKLAQTSTILTEGVTPTDTALATTAITATVDQLGAYVTLTDLAELTVKHPLLQESVYLLGLQAVESIDTIIANVLLAGTQVQYANGRASRGTLVAGDVMTTTEFRKATKLLRRNGAMPFEDGNFVMVIDPGVEADILADTLFVNAASYSQTERLNNAEVGKWLGITVVRSNNLQFVAGTPNVHTSLVFGRNAYAVSDLQNLQTYVEAPGTTSDPLHQRRTVGWKVAFKAVILNNNFLLRLETASAYE